jgi:hypothetical protein
MSELNYFTAAIALMYVGGAAHAFINNKTLYGFLYVSWAIGCGIIAYMEYTHK